MGYFSNGSEGMGYQEKYCSRCRNHKDLDDGRGVGCPVWDMHMIYNYEQIKNDRLKQILESFIPTKDNDLSGQCLMFDCIEGEIEGQLHF